ncbi:MAG: alanine:cation symporter family protein [Pseudanabaenales cyanobacterium]|nr:alanine:cation symporter family protein [Pseudanabaenales cyanobacterium]
MQFALLSNADLPELPIQGSVSALVGADQSATPLLAQSFLNRLDITPFLSGMDEVFANALAVLEQTLFLSIYGLPLVVLWLMGGAIFFTLRMAFINIRAFPHAIAVVMGRYDNPDEPGEVTHFQALATALSATVGLGNIAGVAIAIQLGGPGALLWMTLAGLLGMTSKFVECTLGQKYRVVRPDGTIAGGPMYYLSQGLAEMGLKPLGQMLAVSFALICIVASFGGGNMFQVNQSYVAIASLIPFLRTIAGFMGWRSRLLSG